MAKQFQVDTGGTLTTSLASYFKLEDATDFYGSNNLTNVNTATFVSGKVNNALNVVRASSQYLTKSSPTGLPTGATARTYNFWVNFASLVATETVIGHGATTAGNRAVFLYFNTTNVSVDQFGADDGGIAHGMSTGTWYMMTFTYPGAGSTWTIYKNGSSLGTVNPGATPNTQSAFFEIGRRSDISQYSDAAIDEVGVWAKVLSSTEISDLYNGGSGQTMIDVVADHNKLLLLGIG
jgi:hypothetical protein